MGRTRTGGRGGGFTLIELLVVIAVIAVLMAVLLPVLGRVRKQSKAVVCQSKFREWGVVWSVYAAENDHRLGRAGSLGFGDPYFLGPSVDQSVDWWNAPGENHYCPMAAKYTGEIANGGTFTAWRLYSGFDFGRELYGKCMGPPQLGFSRGTRVFEGDICIHVGSRCRRGVAQLLLYLSEVTGFLQKMRRECMPCAV